MKIFVLIFCCALFAGFGGNNLIISTFAAATTPAFSGVGGPAIQVTASSTVPLSIWTVAGTGSNAYYGDGNLALQAGFSSVIWTWIDSVGQLYISDYLACGIRVLSLTTGIISRFAGTTSCSGSISDGMPAKSTSILPVAIFGDTNGNVYFTDISGVRLRKINTMGIISTVSGSVNGYVDGDASVALFLSPYSLWMNTVGDFFVTDYFNCALRKISSSTNKVSTIVGRGPNACGYNGDNLPGTSAWLNEPYDAMGDSLGNIYIAQLTDRVRLLSFSTGLVTTFAGTGGSSSGGDNIPATSCALNSPIKLWVDSLNNVYISEYDEGKIRRVDSSGIITTFAGKGGLGYSGDGGPPTSAMFNQPRGLTMDTIGRMFIGDTSNYRVRLIGESYVGSVASRSPSAKPTQQPTVVPSPRPSLTPSSKPTGKPTGFPTNQPSSKPSSQPSTQPSGVPSCLPTSQPSANPTGVPSRQPSVQPSSQPTTVPSSRPSLKPSSQPSSLPTQLPTIRYELLMVPLCADVIISVGSTSASLACIFSQVSLYAGTVYCTAYSLGDDQNQNPILTNESTAATMIIATSSPVNFLPTQSNVSMTLTGLTPFSPYISYCAMSLNDGRVSSFSDIDAMKRRWNTTCCKSVSFIQNPAIIYENINNYYDISNFQSHYAFKFQLSSLPRNELIVQPQFLFPNWTGVDKKQYEISPASFQFTSTSTSSTGSFVVFVNGSIPESDYLLSLNLFGSSTSEFDMIIPSVEVVIRQSTPLPPILKGVIFGDSGKDMIIFFNSPTNQANYLVGQDFSCNELFNFSSSNVTPCYFLNSTSVCAILPIGTNTTLPLIQESVFLLPKKIKAACASSISQDVCQEYNFAPSTAVSIAAPFNPVVPNIIITVPSIVGSCDNISVSTLLTSGLGGRLALFARWTVYSISGLTDTSNIETILNSYGVDCIRSFSFSRSLLGLVLEDEYSLSLQITNWMGYTASSTVIIKTSLQSDVPRLVIFDGRAKYMTASQVFDTFAKAYYSSCDTRINVMQYSWSLLDATNTRNKTLLSMVSSSNDPTIYELPSYSLTPRHIYQLRLEVSINGLKANLTAVGSLSIIVNPGRVHAVILGGSRRSVPYNMNVTIDGSASYDEDAPLSRSNFDFTWSCLITSLHFYGKPCNSIFTVPASDPTDHVVVIGERLSTNVTYSLQLRVSTADGRAAVNSVSVIRSPEYSAIVSIESVKSRFNTNANLTVDGSIKVNKSVTVTWDAFIEGKSYSFDSFTPVSLDLKQSYVVNSFVYSLIASASTFKPGMEITLRLAAFELVPVVSSSSIVRGNERTGGRLLQSYSREVVSMAEILLIANGPATSGSLQVEPSAGLALSTDFQVETSGWVDDPSNYPLTFAFYFRRFESNQPALTLQSRSRSPLVISNLPQGNPFYQYRLTVEVVVFNVHDAQQSLSAAVQVFPNPNLNMTSYLAVHLTEALMRTDTDLMFSTVNNAAETLNQINCTLASPLFCQGLHRNQCENKPQTCGSCITGFEGVVGSANSLCFMSNASNPAPGKEGEPCRVNDDCLYGDCKSGTCVTPSLSCPSVYLNRTCSGHGRCSYFDLSGRQFKRPCLITDVYCKPACICDSEYGGRDCSLLSSDLKVKDGNRGTLCEAIVQITNMTRISTGLVSSLISSLFVSYDPVEVFSNTAEDRCSQSLVTITNFVADGYLVREGASTSYQAVQQTLVNTISNFAKSNDDGRYSYLDGVMTKATEGMFHTMKNGQRPIVLTSTNVQINLNKELVSDLEGASLAPPYSEAEAYYGTTSAIRFELVKNAAEGCESSRGYSHFSVMQWGNNPFPNASNIESPMLRFAGKFSDSYGTLSNGMSELVNETLYYVVLPFIQRQGSFPVNVSNFLSAYQKRLNHVRHPRRALKEFDGRLRRKGLLTNLTFPDCTIFEGGGYISCENCDISSFTANNVTFQCQNIRNLCQTSSAGEGSRRLVGDDDYFGDDTLGSGQEMTAEQYGALLQSAASFFASSLSSNPFDVNIEEAKITLTFVGSLIVGFVVGLLLLRLWDFHDRTQFFYAHQWPPKSIFSFHYNLFSLDKKRNQEFRQQSGYDSPANLNRRSPTSPFKKLKINHDSSFRAFIEPLREGDLSPSPGGRRKKHSLLDDHILTFFDLIVPNIFHTSGNEGEEEGNVKKGSLQRSWRIFSMLLFRHDYTTIFAHSSAEMNRVMKWMDLFNGILNGLFISTLFYGTFYANTGECESYLDQLSCATPLNSITGLSQCTWASTSDDDSHSLYHDDFTGSCSLSGPPGNFTFVIILALTCTLVALPLQMIVQYVLDEYCRKRPRLEDVGFNTEEWLGFGVKTVEVTYEHSKDKMSRLQRHYMKMEKGLNVEERAVKEDSYNENALKQALFHALTSEEEVQHILQMIHMLYERIDPDENKGGRIRSESELTEHKEENIDDRGGHFIEEEFIFLANLPSKLYIETWKEFNDARKEEIIRILQYSLSHHAFYPLSLYQRFVCGHSSQYERLISMISRSREKSVELSRNLEELHKIHPQLQEIQLLYSFVLEQLTPFKKWILKYQLNCYEGFLADSIGFWSWLLGWVFVLGTYLFYCYWIFAWSISNGNLLLKDWGLNFAIGAIQDIFFIQIAKLILLFYIATTSIKPQLIEIKHILVQSAMFHVQSISEVADDCTSSLKSRMISDRLLRSVSSQSTKQFSLQSTSGVGTPRSARLNSSIYRAKVLDKLLLSSLSVRKLLKQQFSHHHTQFSMVQHVSHTCRTAWKHPFKDLFMSKLLQQMDDYDVIIMRRQRRNHTGVISILLIFIPIGLALLGVTFADLLLDVIFPLFSNGLLLSGYYLYSVGLIYLLIPWIIIIVLMFWYFGFFRKVYNYAYRRSDELMDVRGAKVNSLPKIILQRQSSHRSTNTQSSDSHTSATKRSVPNLLAYTFQRIHLGLKSAIPAIARWFQAVMVKQKEERLSQIWRCMNLPIDLHGRTIPPTSHAITLITQVSDLMDSSSHLHYLKGLLKVYYDRKLLKKQLKGENSDLNTSSFDDGEPIICDDFDFKRPLDQEDESGSINQENSFFHARTYLLTPEALPKPIRAITAGTAYRPSSSIFTTLTKAALKAQSPSISTYIERWKNPKAVHLLDSENFISSLLATSLQRRAQMQQRSRFPYRLAKLYLDKRSKFSSIDEVMHFLTTSLIEKQLYERQNSKYLNPKIKEMLPESDSDEQHQHHSFLEKYRRLDSDDDRDHNDADIAQSIDPSFHDPPSSTNIDDDVARRGKFEVDHLCLSDYLRLKEDKLQVEDMVTCITLQGYYWLVQVSDLKTFLKETLWEVYEPHLVVVTPSISTSNPTSLPASNEQRRFLLSKEEKEEFLQSFSQWITLSKDYEKEMNDFFLMVNVTSFHLNHNIYINHQSHNYKNYISLHLFKQWLEKQVQHIIKIKTLNNSY